MNPQCAKCRKTVYPMEKLNCLDQFWHKACFRCESCNMQLNMKNYKGYNKKPYCVAHYPTTKFTAVSDTPENLRLKKQQKQQSQIEYHKDFEKEKGHFTAVSDDPETMRAKKASAQASTVQYSGATETMRLGTSGRGGGNTEIEGYNPHQPQYEQRRASLDRDHGRHQQQFHPPPPQQFQPPPSQPEPPRARAPSGGGPRYKAMYDYNAADDDEVGFMEGDYIVNVEVIDEGWMTGTVERTGHHGMLPANYVERA